LHFLTLSWLFLRRAQYTTVKRYLAPNALLQNAALRPVPAAKRYLAPNALPQNTALRPVPAAKHYLAPNRLPQ